jgi:hypothetical protein
LLFEIVAAPYSEAVAHVAEIAASDLSAPERVRQVIRQHLSNSMRHYPAIAIYVGSTDLPMPEEMHLLDQQYWRAVKRILLEGMRDGSFRMQDPAIAVLAVIGMCNWFAIRYRPNDGWSLDEVADEFARTCLGGLAA